MPGWPSPDRTDDRRLAESLAAGDADALPQIFDGHAARLFDYCHALLRDQESAAAVLHDAFLAAGLQIGRLGEPERFRAWLYALVRNGALRRLHDPERPAEQGFVLDPASGEARPRHEAPEVEDAFLDAEELSRRQETRQLVHSALSGLSGRQREALDLLLRHDLAAQEIGGVMGFGEQEAADLAEDAQGRLDDALAAAVIARTGRDECPSVAALVDTWEWPLTPVVCRKLIRHIETCPTCTERRNRKVSTARLLKVLPVALMPAELRGRVMAGATLPEYAADREEAARRAEPFTEEGWPVPVEQPGHRAAARGRRRGADGARQGTPQLWPAIAAAVMVVAVVSAAFVLMPGSGKPAAGGSSPKTSAPAVADASDSPSDSAEPTESPEPTPSPSRSSPSPSASPEETERSPSPSARPTRTPKTGSLRASGCVIPANAQSCTITLSAAGGTVRWRVSSANGVGASGSGTLASGYSVGVSATRPSTCRGQGGSGSVSFSPSGSAGVRWTCPPPDPTPGGPGDDPPN